MARITLEEWPARLDALATLIKQRWPWLLIGLGPTTGALHIEIVNGPRMSAIIDLRLDGASSGRYLRVNANVGSAPALNGSLSEIEVGVQNYRTLLDVLHFCECSLQDLEIWHADQMPCDNCSGTGKIRKTSIVKRQRVVDTVECTVCGGSGKRKDAK